jgi:hypothetical protein
MASNRSSGPGSKEEGKDKIGRWVGTNFFGRGPRFEFPLGEGTRGAQAQAGGELVFGALAPWAQHLSITGPETPASSAT